MLALTAFHMGAILAAGILLIVAAISDMRRYRIPNIVCIALFALFPIFVATAPSEINWKQNIMVFGLVLISGYAMFLAHLIGAGDIKLLAATSLWAGPHLIAVLLVTTAIAGGLLAVAIAGKTYLRHRAHHPAAALARVPIPYGVAIGLGGLNTLYMLAQPILFPG
jgi:prepilin peptidase CpaA